MSFFIGEQQKIGRNAKNYYIAMIYCENIIVVKENPVVAMETGKQ